jgi:hypothetical protein
MVVVLGPPTPSTTVEATSTKSATDPKTEVSLAVVVLFAVIAVQECVYVSVLTSNDAVEVVSCCSPPVVCVVNCVA